MLHIGVGHIMQQRVYSTSGGAYLTVREGAWAKFITEAEVDVPNNFVPTDILHGERALSLQCLAMLPKDFINGESSTGMRNVLINNVAYYHEVNNDERLGRLLRLILFVFLRYKNFIKLGLVTMCLMHQVC